MAQGTVASRLLIVMLVSLGLIGGLRATPALGQDAQQSIFGVVVEVTPNQAVVSTSTGPAAVRLSPGTVYEQDSPGALEDIQPGQMVGVTGRPVPEGLAAVEIHVFPTLLNFRQGQSQMSGANAGNVMTNATVESLTDGVLLLNFADQHVAINTSADTSVTRPEPAPASAVREGARIAAGGTMGLDGTLQADVVWISAAR
jgi:hypothetical protein